MYQGEFLADGKPLTSARHAENNQEEFVCYSLGYNDSIAMQRAHDVLTLIAFARSAQPSPSQVCLLATDGAGPWAAAALAQAPGSVERAALDTAGFRFTGLKSTFDVNFVPGVAKYGDLPGLLSLAAPTDLWLAGEGAARLPLWPPCIAQRQGSRYCARWAGGHPSRDSRRLALEVTATDRANFSSGTFRVKRFE